MKQRILELIEYATNGNKARFAEKCGWKGQYLQNVLRGCVGISPITTILKTFPEINARWLILGQGNMLDGIDALQNELYDISVQMEQLTGKIRSLSGENVQYTCNDNSEVQ